jgi:hypothetical protein
MFYCLFDATKKLQAKGLEWFQRWNREVVALKVLVEQ